MLYGIPARLRTAKSRKTRKAPEKPVSRLRKTRTRCPQTKMSGRFLKELRKMQKKPVSRFRRVRRIRYPARKTYRQAARVLKRVKIFRIRQKRTPLMIQSPGRKLAHKCREKAPTRMPTGARMPIKVWIPDRTRLLIREMKKESPMMADRKQ